MERAFTPCSSLSALLLRYYWTLSCLASEHGEANCTATPRSARSLASFRGAPEFEEHDIVVLVYGKVLRSLTGPDAYADFERIVIQEAINAAIDVIIGVRNVNLGGALGGIDS
jgi:hypothetical protein